MKENLVQAEYRIFFTSDVLILLNRFNVLKTITYALYQVLSTFYLHHALI